MYCKNCGAMLEEGAYMCPTCGEQIIGASSNVISGNPIGEEVKSTGILVFSIIELFCCNFICGLISVILYFLKLKPSVESGNIEEAKKSKKTIKIVLWLGLILNLVIILLLMLISIPNFSGTQSRMQVRADTATAAQIGKAIRIWYTDAITDPDADFDYEDFEDRFVRIDEIEGIINYVDPSLFPSSYFDKKGMKMDGAYYATLSGEEGREKVVVAIGPRELYNYTNDSRVYETFYEDIEEITETDYTGIGSGIAYVEP